MKSEFDTHNIEVVKERIIDSSLFYGCILGYISFFINYFNRLLNFDLTSFLVIDFVTISILFLIVLYRKSVSFEIKIITIIFAIAVLVFTDLYRTGLSADNKILLILIPFYLQLIFNLKKTVIVFALMLLVFLGIGILYVNSYTSTASDLPNRLLSLNVWIINILLTIIVSISIIILFNQYTNSFYSLIFDLKEKNSELIVYKAHLETLVEERTLGLKEVNNQLIESNNELHQKSELIIKQNEALLDALNNLKSTQTQLVQAEKLASLGFLVSGIAHEINNPLNFMKGGCMGMEQCMEREDDFDRNEMLVYINIIKEGIQRASDIVMGLNEFSRNNELMDESCDVHAIIDNCMRIIKSLLKERITIKKCYSDNQIVALGNMGKLHQLFMNIIINAIHSIEDKGTIELRTSISNDFAVIEVIDSGMGISEENLSKIMDPFFTTKAPGKGTGLGLAISNSIVNAHNGKIEFTSELGKGTTVKISLPLIMS